MNTPTCGELSCDECNARTAALTTERDHWQKIAVSASHEREHNAHVAQAMTAERDQLRADRTYNHECINRLAVATGTLGEKSEKVVDVVLSTIDQLRARAERAEAELAKYLSACPASPTEEERKRCQQWWAISGRSP